MSTATVDWSVLRIDGVMDMASRAARRVSDQYSTTIEFEDALQNAYLILGTKGVMVRECLDNPNLGLGVLSTRLVQDLTDQVKTEAKHRSGHVSYERSREGRE